MPRREYPRCPCCGRGNPASKKLAGVVFPLVVKLGPVVIQLLMAFFATR